jgi:hypothetical protein
VAAILALKAERTRRKTVEVTSSMETQTSPAPESLPLRPVSIKASRSTLANAGRQFVLTMTTPVM